MRRIFIRTIKNGIFNDNRKIYPYKIIVKLPISKKFKFKSVLISHDSKIHNHLKITCIIILKKFEKYEKKKKIRKN